MGRERATLHERLFDDSFRRFPPSIIAIDGFL